MSRLGLKGASAGFAVMAAGSAAIAALGGVALAQQVGDGSIPAPAPLVEKRDPAADIAAADAAAAEAAALAAAQAQEDAAAAAETEAEAEQSEAEAIVESVGRRGPSAAGQRGAPVADQPQRRITLGISQGFNFDSDPSLDGSGSTFGASTTFSATYTSVAPTSSLSLGLNGSIRVLGGEGADDSDTVVPLPSFRAAYSASLSRSTSFGANFNLSITETAFENADVINLVLTEDGDLALQRVEGDEGNAQRLSLGAGFSLSHAINRRNSVSMGLSLSRSDFIDNDSDTLNASTSGGLNFSWSHQARQDLSTTFGASISASRSEAADEAQSLSLAVTGGGNWRVDRLTVVQGSLGPSLTFSDDAVDGSDLSVGLRAQGGFSYSSRRASFDMAFANNVVPADSGAISNLTALSVGGRYRINTLSSIGAQMGLSWQQPLNTSDSDGDDTLSLNSTLSYSYALTEDMNANLGYGLRWRSSDGEADMSHRVFLTLSRSFTFLP